MKKLLVVAVIAACGSGGGASGVDGSALIISLSSSQQAQECQYLFDTYPPRTVTCSAQETVTLGEKSVADCETSLAATIANNPNCMASVAQGEACLEAEYALSDSAACGSTSVPTECAPIVSASCSATGRAFH